MNGDDLDVLLTHDSLELSGRFDAELERQLAWLRCWYGSCVWPQPDWERLRAKNEGWR